MRVVITIEVVRLVDSIYGYKGKDENEKILFQNTFKKATEGIVEYLGAVHGLMYIKKNQLNGEVRVKNSYIKECIDNKKYEYKVNGEDEDANKTNEFIRRCRFWVLEQKKSLDIYLIPEVSDNFSKRKTWFNERD